MSYMKMKKDQQSMDPDRRNANEVGISKIMSHKNIRISPSKKVRNNENKSNQDQEFNYFKKEKREDRIAKIIEDTEQKLQQNGGKRQRYWYRSDPKEFLKAEKWEVIET